MLLCLTVPWSVAKRRYSGDGPHCGRERWEVKELSDDRARDVDFTPKKRTIAELLTLERVVPRHSEPRRDDEMQTFRVRCAIIKYKLEDDGDLHLVIQDPGNPSAHMVAEIPDPTCPDAIAGGHAAQFNAARDMLFELFAEHPPRPRMQSVDPPPIVEITGVGFYDFPHGQTGMAPNNLELHPVLLLKVAH